MRPSILIVACDPYLAGIFGRKFEQSGWDVHISESLKEAEQKATKMQPLIFLIGTDCEINLAHEIRRLRTLPTLQRTKIVVLSKSGTREEVNEMSRAGASEYLIAGHFVPQEAVLKMKRLLSS